MRNSVRILSENPIEQLWLHLSRLESLPLARKAIEERANTEISADVLDQKAIGVAYALRSAREYLANPSESQTKRVLATYYGMMSFLSAVLIADPTSKYDLAELEAATKAGHGLGSVDDDAAAFPVAQKIYVTNNGFLHRYLKHLGVDPASVKIAKRFERIDELAPEEQQRLVTLDELWSRVPELADFYFEVTGRQPLSAQVFGSDRNIKSVLDVAHRRMDAGGPAFAPSEPAKVQWVGVRAPGLGLDDATALTGHLAMPIADVQVEEDKPTQDRFWVGSVAIPEGRKYWHEALPLYKSPMCPTSWFRPVLGVTDPLVLHFATLYVLSIIVRYRPKLWREITEGTMTQYLALLRSYLSVVDRVVPEIVLGRILDRRVHTVQPGSFNAPL